MTSAPLAFTYRRELDGLRGFALIAVILYHAGYTFLPGGYSGVDVFFVLSGYLICSMIVKDLDRERFSFLEFFERRARRIFPALFSVMLVTLALSLVILFPADLRNFGSGLASVGAFASNILFARREGYFDVSSELNPLIHTWTLSVEEQFYLFFPPLLFVLWRWGIKPAAAAWSVVLLASLAAAEMTVRSDSLTAFYYLHTRAWEFLVGALAGIVMSRRDIAADFILSRAAANFGFALILFSFFWLEPTSRFPGLSALPAVTGAVLVILFAQPGGIVYRMMAWGPLVAAGLMSYSIYLWHQPLFAFARQFNFVDPYGLTMPLLIALTVGLSYASWRWIENPVRDRRNFSRKTIFTASAGALVASMAAGLGLYATDGLPGRFSPELLEALEPLQEPAFATSSCRVTNGSQDELSGAIADCYRPGETIYLVGDSHAGAIDPALREYAEAQGFSLVTLERHSCTPVFGLSLQRSAQPCSRFREQVRGLIAANPAPIVLAGRWRMITTGEPFDNGEGGRELGHAEPIMADGRIVQDTYAVFEQSMRNWGRIAPVVVVDQIPEAGWLVRRTMARRAQFGFETEPLSTSYAEYQRQNADVNTVLGRLAARNTIEVVRSAPLVCSESTGRCLNELDGRPLYFDDDHPSLLYSRLIAAEVMATATVQKVTGRE